MVWNVSKRHWVHWDGNTQSPLGRNLLASLGLGAPLHGKHGELDFALIKRQTDLSEMIQPRVIPTSSTRQRRNAVPRTMPPIASPATADLKATNASTPSPTSAPIRFARSSSRKSRLPGSTSSSLNWKLPVISHRKKKVFVARENIGRRAWTEFGRGLLSTQRIGAHHARAAHPACATRENISPWFQGLRRHPNGLHRCRPYLFDTSSRGNSNAAMTTAPLNRRSKARLTRIPQDPLNLASATSELHVIPSRIRREKRARTEAKPNVDLTTADCVTGNIFRAPSLNA